MAFVAEIFRFIGQAIGLVLGIVEGIVLWIVREVLPTVAAAIGITVGALATLAIFAPAAAAALAAKLIEIVGGTIAFLGDVVTGVVEFTIDTVDMIVNNFDEFLAAIHFDLIMDVHEILWILSDDYRALISQLFDAISQVSEALFGDSNTLLMIFQNTRSIILSTSSLLGYEYDIAQIAWLANFNDILVKFNEKAEIYMENPEQLFLDLEEWAERASINAGGLSSQADRLAIKGALAGVKDTLIKVDAVKDDFGRFAFNLPAERGRAINQALAPINLRLGDFQFSTYERHRLETDAMVKDNRESQEMSRKRISSIEWETERPSRSLGKIDKLPPDDREAEEVAVEEYATREYGRDNEELVSQHEEKMAEEDAEKVVEEVYLPPPSWEAIVEKEVTELRMEKSKKRDSPFVGDY